MLESKNWTIPRKQSCYALINIHIFEIVSFQNSIFLGGNKKKKKLKASFCNKIDLIEFYFSFFSFYFYPTFSTKTFQFTRFFLPCTLSIQKFFSILSISIAIKKKKKEQSLQNFSSSDDKSFKSTWRNISKYFTIAIDKSPRKKYIFRLKIFRTKIKKRKKEKRVISMRDQRES